jgi:hypothetical protein
LIYCSRTDPQRRSPAPGERRINDVVHFLQENADSIVLPFGEGDLNRIAERQHLPPLIRPACESVHALLSRSFREIGE